MSNFQMSITFAPGEWEAMTDIQKAYWQKFVDETCDPVTLKQYQAQFDNEQIVADGE